MKNLLIIGAGGGIAQIVTELLLNNDELNITLMLRNARRLRPAVLSACTVIEGDVLDKVALRKAMTGKHIVYINLAGDLEQMNKAVVAEMKEQNVKTVIFISSIGIYETPLKTVLIPYRKGADVIEGSCLDYTILRPEWFSNSDETAYETTRKGVPEKGGTVSRKALATLITDIIYTPENYRNENLGVNSPD